MWASGGCQECGVVLINLEEQDLCPFRRGSGADRSELCLWFPFAFAVSVTQITVGSWLL